MRTNAEDDCSQRVEGMTIGVILLDLLLQLSGATMTSLLAGVVAVTAEAGQKGGRAADVSSIVLYPVRSLCVASIHRPKGASQKPSTTVLMTIHQQALAPATRRAGALRLTII
jgi:hypothetical protein